MNCTECNLSLTSSEEFQEHMSKYHLMGIMINTSKGSNKMFTRTMEGHFNCPTCFGTCENINEVLNHLFCEIKPPETFSSLIEGHITKPNHKRTRHSLDVEPLNSLPPLTTDQFPISCGPEEGLLHYHFIPVKAEHDEQKDDSNIVSVQSKRHVQTFTSDNPVRDLFIYLLSKYIKSIHCANSMFNRIDAIPEGKYLTWSYLLEKMSSSMRPKSDEGKKVLKELVDAGLIVIKQPTFKSIRIQKGPKFFIE